MVSWLEAWLNYLRAAGKGRGYIISKHAHKRMGERDVSDDDVQRCLIEGRYLEHQDHGRDIKYLLQSECENGSTFYMIVASAQPRPVIVTVCRFRDDVWEDMGPMRRRK